MLVLRSASHVLSSKGIAWFTSWSHCGLRSRELGQIIQLTESGERGSRCFVVEGVEVPALGMGSDTATLLFAKKQTAAAGNNLTGVEVLGWRHWGKTSITFGVSVGVSGGPLSRDIQ